MGLVDNSDVDNLNVLDLVDNLNVFPSTKGTGVECTFTPKDEERPTRKLLCTRPLEELL